MSRKCQPCTGCCDGWVQMVIDSVVVSPGNPCPHSTGKGCNDYLNRPTDPCGNFRCGWIMENSPLPDWLKPNSAKVIVIFDKLRWHNLAVDLAVPVGVKIPSQSLAWLKKFSQQQGRPLLYTEQTLEAGRFANQQQVYGYGPIDFQNDLRILQQSGKKLW